MNRKILIATHGMLASGFKDALNIITGKIDNITVINAFSKEQNPKKTIQQFMEQINKDDELIVFTDLMGGSVNQMLMKYLEEYEFHLITGINLGLLCQLVLSETITSKTIIDAIDEARLDIRYVNEEIEHQSLKGSQSSMADFLL
jgi:mannose/fructose-specific phosphotransferase system component IIA